MELLICALIVLATLAFIWRRLAKTDVDIPPEAEVYSEREDPSWHDNLKQTVITLDRRHLFGGG